jgi:hypothetical protein
MIDFARLLQRLTTHQVAFIIVGGGAAVIHGSSRLTQDLDVIYQRTPENLTRVVQAWPITHPACAARRRGCPFVSRH